MKIDLTCPVEIWACKRPDADYPACELTLFNLSDKNIVSVEVTMLLEGAGGEELSRLIDRNRDLCGLPGHTFHMPVAIPEDLLDTPVFRPAVGKVWYEDGTVWRATSGQVIEYRSNALPNSRALNALRAVAGENLVAGYPEEQGELWLCVCGRPNPQTKEVCARCGRAKRQVFEAYNREAVEAALSKRRSDLDTQTRQVLKNAAGEEKPTRVKRKKKHKWILPTVLIVLLVCAAAYAGYFHVWPWLRYQKAVSLLEAGDTSAAEEAFTALGDWGDAATQVTRCRYAAAQALLEEGVAKKEADILQRAQAAFAALGDFEDSADRALDADYQRALTLLGNGQSARAGEVFAALGTWRDSEEMVTRCAYEQATELLESGRYAEASAAFSAIADYSDSAEKAQLAMYRAGQAALAADNLTEAIAAFEAAGGYQDSATLIQRCHYTMAQRLFDEGDTTAAGQEYLLAGDYEDAAEQAIRCIYTPAIGAMSAGSYAKAATLFASILDYADSAERWRECVLEEARKAMNDLEFIRARELLTQLSAEDEDVAALRSEIDYNSALAALNRGEYESAIRSFALLGDYADSAAQLRGARYTWAQSLESAGELAEAAAMYEQLGTYSDSAARLNVCRYALADQAMQAGDYAQAAALYADLGSYRQSAARLREAQWAQAEALFAEGDYIGARATYALLGSYQGADTQVDACDYALAQALADAGDVSAAIAAFDALGDYGDAAEQANALRYAQAMTLAETDPAAAIEALDALGDYGDAAEQANALRYAQAMTLAETDPAAAIEALDALGDYGDAAEQARLLCLKQIETFIEAGKREEAIARLSAMADDAEAAERLSALYVTIGQEAEAAGDLNAALQAYTTAGEDGQPYVDALGERVYEEAALVARQAAEAGDFALCAYALDGLALADAPKAYADLPELYRTACAAQVQRLLAAGEEEKAYPYAQRVAEEPFAAELLSALRWRILGTWGDTAHTLTLTWDGQAELDGETFACTLEGYNLLSDGKTALKLVTVADDRLVLRDVRHGDTAMNLTRLAQAPLVPLPEPAPATASDLSRVESAADDLPLPTDEPAE